MNAQRPLDAKKVSDYKTLALELCEIYYPASKTAIAEMIGVSQKTIYNMIYGEPVGVYTRKRLARFLKETDNYDIKNIKDNNIKLVSVGVEAPQKTTDNFSAVDSSNTVNDLNTELLQLLLSDNKELKRKLANLVNENNSLAQEVIKLNKELIEMGNESIRRSFEKLDKKFSK